MNVASSNLSNKRMMDFGLQESEKIITITFIAHLLKVNMYARDIKIKTCLGLQIALRLPCTPPNTLTYVSENTETRKLNFYETCLYKIEAIVC